MTRLIHYLTSLGFLIASFVVYQNTFVRWLEPESIEAIAIKPVEQLQVDHCVDDLFVEGAWQRGACKCLQTAEGMLLFERREQTAPNKWRLWPITVVMGRGMDDRAAEPVIMDASQGAEIELTSSLNVIGGASPSIRRGRLIGPVRIYRNPAARSDSRAFDLNTSNVGIDTRKIWTTDAIEMRFGNAKIVGRDLTIHLAGDPTASKTNAESALDRMELIYLDEFTMPIESKASDGSIALSRVALQCGGRVEYDFALHRLSLRESVSLIHETDQGFTDRFDCESLLLGLNDPGNQSISREGPLDWINQVHADGNPVVVSLPSFNAEIIADKIALDARAGTLEAQGKKGIRIRRGSLTASLANLFYQFNPQAADELGALLVDGAGIVSIKDPEVALRQAQWKTGLELKPLHPTTMQAFAADIELSVQGDVHAWLIDGGEFQADEIIGRLKSMDANDSLATVSQDPGPGEPRHTLVPDAFEITGNVRIATSAIIAKTDTLKLFFEDDLNPSSGYSEQDLDPHDATATSPFRQWVTQPSEPGSVDRSLSEPVARPTPEIRGDLIVAKLRRNSSGLSVNGLKVSGSVVVKHTIHAGEQNLATTLTGELLQLIDSGGEDVLQLGSGVESPARFDIGDGYFIGPEIQIRPSENMIWIKDAGEFRIPTDALPSSWAGGVSAEKSDGIQWTKPPHCRWQGEMRFDGQVAVLTEGVDIDAAILNGREPWEFKMSGEQLEVRLWESVELTNMQTMQTAKVRSIELLESPDRPVLLEAKQWAPDGVLQTRHLMYANKLVMTPGGGVSTGVGVSTGALHPIPSSSAQSKDASPKIASDASSLVGVIVGQGPGWYRSWMPASKETGRGMESANATMIDDAERPLMGVHLTFNESMTANLSQKSLEFTRGVRVGLRPLAHWEETFDAAEMNSLAMSESTLDCDRLRVTADPGVRMPRHNSRLLEQPFAWEMEAIRGVVFRTRSPRGTIQATAARASYASAKDLFVILGAPSRPAIIRQTRPDGKPGMEASVKSALIRPKTMEIENAEIIGVNIAAPSEPLQRR